MRQVAIGLGAGLIALVASSSQAAEPAPTFEGLMRDASRVTELSALVAPFVDDCGQIKREVDRVRCQGVRASLRAQLAAGKALFVREGARAVVVSDYDGRTRSVRLAVKSCLACEEPVVVGEERRFVTLSAPSKSDDGAPVAAELFHTSVTFPSAAAADQWAKNVKPNLRVELVFRAVAEPWTVGENQGLAFKPLGLRVSDRCTGEVLGAEPPSRASAPRSKTCGSNEASAVAPPAPDDDRPETLGATEINQAIAGSRKELDGCLSRFRVGGTASLDFVVANTGVPRSVTVGGSVAGTALSQCLADVGSRMRFPRFRAPTQAFKYPLLLRR